MEDIQRLASEWSIPEVLEYGVPSCVHEQYSAVAQKNAALHEEWKKLWEFHKANYQAEHQELERRLRAFGGLSAEEVLKKMPSFEGKGAIATRQISQTVLQAIAPIFPEFIGGSADLMKSNLTDIKSVGVAAFSAADNSGRYIHFGIREHAMCGIANGMAAWGHHAFCPFTATFLVFTGYALGAIRVAALSHLR